ncbi:Glucan 1 3-beta-glucosidase A [Bienertia sinuspersici]
MGFVTCKVLVMNCQGARINRKVTVKPAFKVKAVNLGGWLITEEWQEPFLFDGIINKDLLDGSQIQLKSVSTGKYVSAENGGGSILSASKTSASDWESFKLWRIDENTFNFRVSNKQFAGVQSNGSSHAVVATANTPGASETFKIIRKANDTSRVRIQAPNGLFLQAKTENLVSADYAGEGGWGNDNPSVFEMTASASIGGEFQLTNGLGPERAPQVMRVSNILISLPFVGGSLEALDNAFSWAKKYGIQVIVDLHAAPGSQNGNGHSAARDGSLEWGKTDDTIQKSVAVIDFLTSRYANNTQLYAVELINEPMAPGVSLEALKRYYKLGYDAVRKHSKSAYVIMSNRLGPARPRELFPLASGLHKTVIDVHYYNLFEDKFNNMTAQQNIDYIYNKGSSDVSYVTTDDGPLTFVGEWVTEWKVKGATKTDYQRFAKAQLEVYGRASFGWAYWSFKNSNNHWNLPWMIQNGYIKLTK